MDHTWHLIQRASHPDQQRVSQVRLQDLSKNPGPPSSGSDLQGPAEGRAGKRQCRFGGGNVWKDSGLHLRGQGLARPNQVWSITPFFILH